jgi:hypothetical protein
MVGEPAVGEAKKMNLAGSTTSRKHFGYPTEVPGLQWRSVIDPYGVVLNWDDWTDLIASILLDRLDPSECTVHLVDSLLQTKAQLAKKVQILMEVFKFGDCSLSDPHVAYLASAGGGELLPGLASVAGTCISLIVGNGSSHCFALHYGRPMARASTHVGGFAVTEKLMQLVTGEELAGSCADDLKSVVGWRYLDLAKRIFCGCDIGKGGTLSLPDGQEVELDPAHTLKAAQVLFTPGSVDANLMGVIGIPELIMKVTTQIPSDCLGDVRIFVSGHGSKLPGFCDKLKSHLTAIPNVRVIGLEEMCHTHQALSLKLRP